jgi:hypothetical protein
MVAELTFAVVLAFGGAVSTQMREIGEAERAGQPVGTQPAGAVPVISSPTPIVDLGTILQDDIAKGTFIIENKGNADLKIEELKASCGCTTVQLKEDQKTVPPGGKVEVVASFNSRGRQGPQDKYVTVTSNDPKNKAFRLTLKVFVETLITVKPSPMVNVRDARAGQKIQEYIDLLPGAGEKKLEVTSVQVVPGGIGFAQEPVTEGDRTGVRLRFSVDESAEVGPLNATVTVGAKLGERSGQQVIRVAGKIVGDLTVVPTSVQMLQQTMRGQRLQPIVLKAADGKPFKVLSASGGPALTVEVKNIQGEVDYQILPSVSDAAPDGPVGTYLDIRTTKMSQPLVRIPVFLNITPRVVAAPAAVLLATGGPAEAGSRKILLTTGGGVPIAVTAVQCDKPFVTAAVVPDADPAPRGRKTVEVKLNGNVPAGMQEALVTITTNVKGAEAIVVPVTVIEQPQATSEPAAAAAAAAR